MATRSDFTTEEWETMQKGVTGAGMLVSLSDRGFFDTFKEVGALAKHLKAAHEGSQSTLVRDLAEVKESGFGFTSSPQEVESETLGALRSAMSTLEQKAPEEAPAYRDFVLEVARSVAEATKGVGGGETGSLEKIRDALGSAGTATQPPA